MISCLECNKQYKRLNIFHLSHHGLTEKSYLEKYPDAKIFYDGYTNLISQKTKEGMRKEESWNKFKKFIEDRENKPENLGKYIQKDRILTEEEYNKSYSKERNKRISEARKEFWQENKGKTVEELWGEEKGKNIRKQQSENRQGENNPAFGKVYEKTGSCKAGYYKKQLFRGILEYSYLKFLEKSNIGFKYEPFFIEYTLNNRKRTYHPDYLLEETKKIIEIKPSFYLSEKYFNKEVDAKRQAAEKWCQENGYTYHILTEKDFPIIPYKVAYADPDIEWIRR